MKSKALINIISLIILLLVATFAWVYFKPSNQAIEYNNDFILKTDNIEVKLYELINNEMELVSNNISAKLKTLNPSDKVYYRAVITNKTDNPLNLNVKFSGITGTVDNNKLSLAKYFNVNITDPLVSTVPFSDYIMGVDTINNLLIINNMGLTSKTTAIDFNIEYSSSATNEAMNQELNIKQMVFDGS